LNDVFAPDAVEKVAALRFQISGEKNDLSDRPANRWRTPVKGKKTLENLVRVTVSDFFTSIGRTLPRAISICDARFAIPQSAARHPLRPLDSVRTRRNLPTNNSCSHKPVECHPMWPVGRSCRRPNARSFALGTIGNQVSHSRFPLSVCVSLIYLHLYIGRGSFQPARCRSCRPAAARWLLARFGQALDAAHVDVPGGPLLERSITRLS
jgi:hypothetical protein